MKQLLPFVLFLFLSFEILAQSQLVVEPNPYSKTFVVDLRSSNSRAVSHSSFVNTTDDTLRVKWELILDNAYCPNGWEYLICDDNSCYTAASNQGEFVNRPVVLPPGSSSILDVHFKPNGVANCCKPTIKLSDYDNPSLFYTSADYDICLSPVTAVTEREKANLRVFPNPTTRYISVSENNFVEKLWVSNILGKRVRTFQTSPSNSYDISTLPDGIYLVSMVDESNKVLKTVRISKRNIRP